MKTIVLSVLGVCSVLAQTVTSGAQGQTQATKETTAAERKIFLELNHLKREFFQYVIEIQTWRIAGFEEQIENLQRTRRELEERTRVLSQGASDWQGEAIRANEDGRNLAVALSVSAVEDELWKVRQALREADIRSAAVGEQLRQARARLEHYNVQAHRIETELDAPDVPVAGGISK